MCTFKTIVLSFLVFVGVLPCRAQLTVKGTVSDSLGNPIINVNIYTTGLDSTGIKTFDYTNKEGQFGLKLKLNRAYLLHVSALGYNKKVIKIPKFTTSDTLVKTITLRRTAYQMKALQVEASQKAITVKKDTVIFNVSAFARGNEETVEDLLKNLPGVTVSPTGQLKFNGKTVGKVLIEGDDLFGRNYTMLTQNLTAEAIETVSAITNYHVNPALEGISKSEKTVLNLELKESFKVDFFGTISALYDLDDHYEGRSNVISITKNMKGYLFVNSNNIGKSPAGSIYNLLDTKSSFQFNSSSTLGANTGSSAFINTAPQRVSQLDQNQYLNNQSSLVALSMIYEPVEQLKIQGTGYFLPANRWINMRGITRYEPALELPTLVQQRLTDKNINTWLGKLTAKYTFSTGTNLKYIGTFNTSKEHYRTDHIFRNQPLQTGLDARQKTWNQYLQFTDKVAETKAYRLRVRYKTETLRQDFTIKTPLSGGPFVSDTTSPPLAQHTQSDRSYLGADVTYWSRHSKNLFSIRLGGERQGRNLHNLVARQPTFTGQRYWNRYRAFASLTYRQSLSEDLKAYAKLTGNYSWNVTNLQANIDEFFYVTPQIGVEYKFGDRQYLDVTYSLNQDLPGLTTLYNGRRLAGYRIIREGASKFTLLPTNVLTASYRYGNWEDDFVMNATFNYRKSEKNYTVATTLTSTYNFGAYRLVHDRRMVVGRLGIDQFVDFLRSNLSFQYRFIQTSFTSLFNDTANKLRSRKHLIGVSFRTAFIGSFNMGGGVEAGFSSTKNKTTDNRSEAQYLSGYLTGSVKFSEQFSAEAKYQYYNIEHAGHYSFLSVSLTYELIEDKLSLFLNATNILDETTFQTIHLGSYSTYRKRYALNHRYVMIGAEFSIR